MTRLYLSLNTGRESRVGAATRSLKPHPTLPRTPELQLQTRILGPDEPRDSV